MAFDSSGVSERLLRRRLTWFLSESESALAGIPFRARVIRRQVGELVHSLNISGCTAYLFGGVLRDLLMKPSVQPRDIDIVADCSSNDQLVSVFVGRPIQRTRFGGLRIQGEIPFDIWAMPETWAFKQGLFPPSVENLPRTTFLNVEAIVAEIAPSPGQKRNIFSHGFFDGFLNEIVEMNCEINPFPALCIVRSLITVSQLNFSVGPRLAHFLAENTTRFSASELEDVQLSHYGRVRCSGQAFHEMAGAISEQLEMDSDLIMLPGSSKSQKDFWPSRVA